MAKQKGSRKHGRNRGTDACPSTRLYTSLKRWERNKERAIARHAKRMGMTPHEVKVSREHECPTHQRHKEPVQRVVFDGPVRDMREWHEDEDGQRTVISMPRIIVDRGVSVNVVR